MLSNRTTQVYLVDTVDSPTSVQSLFTLRRWPGTPTMEACYFEGERLTITAEFYEQRICVTSIQNRCDVIIYQAANLESALAFNHRYVTDSTRPEKYIFVVDNQDLANELQLHLNDGQSVYVLKNLDQEYAAIVAASREKLSDCYSSCTGVFNRDLQNIVNGFFGDAKKFKEEVNQRDPLLHLCLQVKEHNAPGWYAQLQQELQKYPRAASDSKDAKITPENATLDNLIKLTAIAGRYHEGKESFQSACENLVAAIKDAINKKVFYSTGAAIKSFFGAKGQNSLHECLLKVHAELESLIEKIRPKNGNGGGGGE